MKILFLTSVYYPAFKSGGPAIDIFLMHKTLIKKGLKVDVMTTNLLLEDRNDIEMNKWVNIEGIRIKYFPYYLKKSYAFSPQMCWEIFKEIKKYDLIHVHMFWSFHALAGSLASIIYKKPYMISPAGALYEEVINMKSRCLKRAYYYLIARHYVNKVSAMHYTTEDERDNVADFLSINSRSFVIPSGVDLNEFGTLSAKGFFKEKYPVLKGKRYILFLGRIHVKKGIDLLVEAFRGLAKKYNDLFLVIAGPDNDNYTKEIQISLKRYSLQDKVLFPGILLGRDKISAYIDAEMFVLSSYSENFANAVVEAMAAGTPVVISNKVGIFKVVEENQAGIVVKPNAERLFYGIKTLFDSPELCNKIRINARKLVKEKYDINMVADLVSKAYKELIK